jgi:hypothetical protein
MRPVFAKHILAADNLDQQMKFDGKPLAQARGARSRDAQTFRHGCLFERVCSAAQVTLVGCVSQYEEKASQVTFVLDDGTGLLPIKMFADSKGMEDEAAPPAIT